VNLQSNHEREGERERETVMEGEAHAVNTGEGEHRKSQDSKYCETETL